jgi:hypothetical protein
MSKAFLFNFQHISIPVIANGGSSNNRESSQNTYEGIVSFWRNTGAASVMVARSVMAFVCFMDAASLQNLG